MVGIAFLSLLGMGIYFDNPLPKDQVLKSLDVSALGADNTFTLNGGFASYLTNRSKSLVVELSWQTDDKGVCRVKWMRFRLRSEGDLFFPLRMPEKDEKGKKGTKKGVFSMETDLSGPNQIRLSIQSKSWGSINLNQFHVGMPFLLWYAPLGTGPVSWHIALLSHNVVSRNDVRTWTRINS